MLLKHKKLLKLVTRKISCGKDKLIVSKAKMSPFISSNTIKNNLIAKYSTIFNSNLLLLMKSLICRAHIKHVNLFSLSNNLFVKKTRTSQEDSAVY